MATGKRGEDQESLFLARPKRRWRTTTDSRHNEPIAPNRLQRDFSAAAPDRVWVADTTYLPVLGGFLFLVAIIDLFSRKVVGWSLGNRLDAELSREALRRALARRSPAPALIFHTDRASEFAAASFRRLLAEVHALQSMSRKSDCWHSGGRELLLHPGARRPVDSTWRYVSDGEQELFTFIERYYNQTRLYSHNRYKTPNEVEAALRNGALGA
jgi:transposase InsO family protein